MPNAVTDPRMEQRMDALQKANEYRVKRAALKRDIGAGRVSIESVLLDPPVYAETATLFDMLMSLPRYGRSKSNRVLRSCRITDSKTIGDLSARQRKEIVDLLNETEARNGHQRALRAARRG